MSIGYEVAMTPLQTAAFYNAIAADGRLFRPRFADALLDEARWSRNCPFTCSRNGSPAGPPSPPCAT